MVFEVQVKRADCGVHRDLREGSQKYFSKYTI